MEKELSYEFVRGYVQSFRDSVEKELHGGKMDNVIDATFLQGQVDACKSILKNMEMWK